METGGSDPYVAHLLPVENDTSQGNENTLNGEQTISNEMKSPEEGDVAILEDDQGQTPISDDAISNADVLFDNEFEAKSPYNSHGGNKKYQALVFAYADEFALTKGDKMKVVRKVVGAIRGRFLLRDESSGSWFQIDQQKAMSKVEEALYTASKGIKCSAKGVAQDAITNADVLCGVKSWYNATIPVVSNLGQTPIPEEKITVADVLCGHTYGSHKGNQMYQDCILDHASEFASTEGVKKDVARNVVNAVHANHGRFLKRDSGTWFEISDEKALQKARMALYKASERIQGNVKSPRASKNRMKRKSGVIHETAHGREQKRTCVTSNAVKLNENRQSSFGCTSALMHQQTCDSRIREKLGRKRKIITWKCCDTGEESREL